MFGWKDENERKKAGMAVKKWKSKKTLISWLQEHVFSSHCLDEQLNVK